MLHEAGLAPDQCTDIIIEARIGELVKIHYATFPGDTLPKVIAAFAQAAKVVESKDRAPAENKPVTLDEMRKAAKPATPALDSGFAIG